MEGRCARPRYTTYAQYTHSKPVYQLVTWYTAMCVIYISFGHSFAVLQKIYFICQNHSSNSYINCRADLKFSAAPLLCPGDLEAGTFGGDKSVIALANWFDRL